MWHFTLILLASFDGAAGFTTVPRSGHASLFGCGVQHAIETSSLEPPGVVPELSPPSPLCIEKYRDPGAQAIFHAWSVRSKLRRLSRRLRRRRRGLQRGFLRATAATQLAYENNENEARVGRTEIRLLSEEESLLYLESIVASSLPPGHERRPDAYGKTRMRRFLRKDQHKDPRSSAERFLRYLAWRREWSIDSTIGPMLASNPPLLFSPDLPEDVFHVMSDMFEVNILPGKEGVRVDLAVGEWRTSDLMKGLESGAFTKRHFLLYWVYQYELIHKELEAESSPSRNILVRADLSGDMRLVSMSQLSKSFVRSVLKVSRRII